MNERTTFIRQLMSHILEGVRIPKLQVERAVGPVLGFFLEDVLTATLAEDEELSGRYRMLCPEFPLLKKSASNLQSTNIDWLLYNETRQELLFLELKTASTSFSGDQALTYLETKLKVLDQGAAFLSEDLDLIEQASLEHQKYAFIRQLLAERLSGGLPALAACHSLRVMYLVPAPMKESTPHLQRMDKALSFSELKEEIDSPFADEWRVICQALKQLDDKPSPSETAGKNYQDLVSFERIKALCSERGAQIVVGFMGGETALLQASPESLQQRKYKWDGALEGQGRKHHANWIAGDRFAEVVKRLSAPDQPA